MFVFWFGSYLLTSSSFELQTISQSERFSSTIAFFLLTARVFLCFPVDGLEILARLRSTLALYTTVDNVDLRLFLESHTHTHNRLGTTKGDLVCLFCFLLLERSRFLLQSSVGCHHTAAPTNLELMSFLGGRFVC